MPPDVPWRLISWVVIAIFLSKNKPNQILHHWINWSRPEVLFLFYYGRKCLPYNQLVQMPPQQGSPAHTKKGITTQIYFIVSCAIQNNKNLLIIYIYQTWNILYNCKLKQDLNAFARKNGRYCCFLEFLDPGWRNANVFIPSLERQYAIS